MANWTEKHIKGLQHQGRIRSFSVPRKVENDFMPPGSVKSKHSKALAWLKWNLWYFANQHSLTLEEEYRFSKERKFKSDWALPAIKILLEYEGGIFMPNSGHNSHTGLQRDIDKYQLAQKEGWRVIRLTAKNYTTVLKTLNEMI